MRHSEFISGSRATLHPLRHPEFISGSQGNDYAKSIDQAEPISPEILTFVRMTVVFGLVALARSFHSTPPLRHPELTLEFRVTHYPLRHSEFISESLGRNYAKSINQTEPMSPEILICIKHNV